ncbi:MAG: hypothetical protein KC589_09050 [Nanoarchaeota archaeon]|nr:hypothetical protein [Nanoarchaeota archaeon]
MVFGIDNKVLFWKGFGLGIIIGVVTSILTAFLGDMIYYKYDYILYLGIPLVGFCLSLFLIYDNFQKGNRNFAKGLIASILAIPLAWGVFILIILMYFFVFGFGW